MIALLKTFKFYIRYYLTNHVISHLPFHRLRLAWYRHVLGVKIGKGSQIWLGCKFIGDAIDQIEIGEYTVLASDVTINASASVYIGDHVNIASGLLITTTAHDCQDPLFAPLKAPVIVHSHVYIASRAMITMGVTIGEGGVVTAGAAVFQNVKSWTIVGGNPARMIGIRPKLQNQPVKPGTPPLFC